MIAVHLSLEDERLRGSLAQLDAEFAGNRYCGRPCSFRPVVIQDDGRALLQVDSEAVTEATWRTVHQLLSQLKEERRRVHLCVAGGPRMLGLLAMSTAMLHFDHQDQLWHLYTPRAFQVRAHDGAILHAGPNDGVHLLEVPIVPWGAYFPALRALAQASSAQVIAAQTRWLDETEQARCHAVIAKLTPRQVDVLRWLAAGHSPQDVAETLTVTIKTVDAHKTAILAECRVVWDLPEDERLTYHFLREHFAHFFENSMETTD